MNAHPKLTYTVGRLCAVATKPLCLFAANNLLRGEAAQGIAVAFLASAISLIAVAAGPERRFYVSHFGGPLRINGYAYYLYLISVILLAAFGSFIAFVFAAHYMGVFALCATTVVYFLSEKLADEVLRLRLFERDFGGWGHDAVLRTVLQLCGLGALLIIPGYSASAWLVLLVLAAANALVFLPQVPRPPGMVSRVSRWPILAWLVRRAVYSIARNWLIWLIALLSAAVSYVDRMVLLSIDKALLPLFSLVVMCFSVTQMAVDFYYVSRHRRDFLERRISIVRAITSRGFIGSATGGLVAAIAACAVVLALSKNGAEFPMVYILFVAGMQLSLVGAAIPREILYWSKRPGYILRVESLFWIVLLAGYVVGSYFDWDITRTFTLLVAAAFVRLTAYMLTAHRVPSMQVIPA